MMMERTCKTCEGEGVVPRASLAGGAHHHHDDDDGTGVPPLEEVLQ